MLDVVKYFQDNQIDPNNQQLFFSIMIKALMLDLNDLIKIRDVGVPHMIINTGDDVMWLLEKEYDYKKEPCDVTNEQYIYNIVPRCVVGPEGVDLLTDQLSNPYSRGQFQIELDNQLYTLDGEYRRMPFKMTFNLKYILGSFTDTLELFQHIITKLAFIRTFKFVYMGQTMIASYSIPESYKDEHQMEISNDNNTETRNRIIDLSIEVETSMPVFAERTVNEIKLLTKSKKSSRVFIGGKEVGSRNKTTGWDEIV